MSEDSSPVRIQLRLEHLLWRTRGRHWDYLFLLAPSARYGHGWYSLHKEIFADFEPSILERYVVGELLDQQSLQNLVFVGTVFLDDSRRDALGRPVAHYMVWLRPGEDLHEVKKHVPQDWGHAVLSRVGYALDADDVLNAIGDDETGIRRSFESLLSASDRTMELEGPPVDPAECRDVGKKATNICSSASDPTTRRSERCLASGPSRSDSDAATNKSDWNADVSNAIAQGEAWALLHDRGWLGRKLPTLPLKLQKINRAEVFRRIIKSFSGSQDDEFIQVRTESLAERAAARYLQEFSRGFDAVVTVLVRYNRHIELSGLTQDKAHTLLAQWIGHGAVKTDLFIHNVYARLRQQAKDQLSSKDPL